ncbi:uncharacterized protein LOC128663630 [Bombina bombina]|uniref:uncharacterized protein LOC128663630 n=1 Tax=Bombina bombina TaxID=8345 RepID=UPI00235A5335|nr:uncharacterized protein LOC128663630 [Bombina bombina]
MLEPDEVFLESSVIVNCNKIPERYKNIMHHLSKKHMDVSFNFDKKQKTCIVSGAYTKVHTVIQEILSTLDLRCKSSKNEQSEMHSKAHIGQLRDKYSSSSPQALMDISHTQGEDQTLSALYAIADHKNYLPRVEPFELADEPFVWDYDIYKFIQKFHLDDYQHILQKHQVQAVDASADGITTLYLQAANENSKGINLLNARFDLLGLYQGLELKLRKEQISKKDIKCDSQFLKKIFKDFQKLCPLLLCHEDGQYLYFIGSAVDVAQAKQYFNDIHGQQKNPEPFTGVQIEEKTKKGKAGESSDQKPRLNRYSSMEASGESKIAAKFNNPKSLVYTQQMTLVEKNGEQQFQEKEKQKSEPLPNYIKERHLLKKKENDIVETDEKPGEKPLAFFKRGEVVPQRNSGKLELKQSTGTLRSVGPVKPVPLPRASSEYQYSSLLDTFTIDSTISGAKPMLRRSNSFSRVYSRNNSVTDKQIDTVLATFKDNATSEMVNPMVTDRIFVDQYLWSYLKDICKSDIENMCGDVLLTEEQNNDVIILIFKASNKSKLFFARENIQSLYNREKDILIIQSLSYETLQLSGPGDKSVDDLCSLLRNCSSKLWFRPNEDNFFLIYPKELQLKVQEEYTRFLEYKKKSLSFRSLSVETHSAPMIESIWNTEQRNLPDINVQSMGGKFQSLPALINTRTHDVPLALSHELENLIDPKYEKQSLSENNQSSDKTYENSTFLKYANNSSYDGDVANKGSKLPTKSSEMSEEFKYLEELRHQNLQLVDDSETSSGTVKKGNNFWKYQNVFSQEETSSSPPQEIQDSLKIGHFSKELESHKATNALQSRFQLDTSKDIVDDITMKFKSEFHIQDEDYKSLSKSSYSSTHVSIERNNLTEKEGVLENRDGSKFSEMRSPAVGQEAEKTNKLCDQCKKDNLTIEVLPDQYLCNRCISSKGYQVTTSAEAEMTNSVVNATMSSVAMNLTVSGF